MRLAASSLRLVGRGHAKSRFSTSAMGQHRNLANQHLRSTTGYRFQDPHSHSSRRNGGLLALLTGAGLAYYFWNDQTQNDAPPKSLVVQQKQQQQQQQQQPAPVAVVPSVSSAQENAAGTEPTTETQNVAVYTAEQVRAHNTIAKRVWVTYADNVYDVTDFIEKHPGGARRIMLAAGGSVEPFWAMYAVHKKPNVLELLQEFYIGKLDQTTVTKSKINDPYENDPRRHPALIIASDKPFNAETPASLLTDHFITPNELFFVRNHLPVPSIDADKYVLEVSSELNVFPATKFTLEELKTKFPKYSVTATIQCAGNRRHDQSVISEVKGLEWGGGAISNAVWSGAKLRDVLQSVGFQDSYYTSPDPDHPAFIKHLHFEGLDHDFEKNYAASIPVEKGMDPRGDVILAYEMNGQDIPLDHGYPVRAIVPGVVGARNVKWLGKVYASAEESQSHWQQNDYKGFSPSVSWNNVDYATAPAIQELPVQSAICLPTEGPITLDNDEREVTVRGYAWSGGGHGIVRVDVTADGGKTWHTAKLFNTGAQDDPNPENDGLAYYHRHQPYSRSWSWTLFEAEVPIPEGNKDVEIACKAVDSSYNTQPESVANVWNLRGVLNNAWHRVHVQVKDE